MTSARRLVPFVLLLVVLGGAAAWLVLSPLGLFEDRAGPLDGLLPPDLDVVVRFDPDSVESSPGLRTLRRHPALRDLWDEDEFEADVLAPLADLEARLGRVSLGLAPRLREDVFGLEAVLALRGGDVLLLTRVTGRGRLVDAAARLDTEEMRAAGLRVEGGVAVLERDGAPPVRLTRVRDVLVASTSPELLATAVALGDPPDDLAPAAASPWSDALGGGAPPGTRVFVCARLQDRAGESALRRRLAPLVPVPLPDELVARIDLGAPDAVTLTLDGSWSEGLPEELAPIAEDVPGGADGLFAEAERLAVPGEAFLVGGLAVRARDAVLALAEAQPPARRDLLDEILAERGQTVDTVAAAIAAHLEDGAAFVVSRLPEADGLELDDPRSGGVHPIPATLVVFRLRGGSTTEAAIAAVAAESEALFGSALELDAEAGPGGARVHRLREHRFGGEWQLLRPALAVVDGLLVFATYDAHLLRALARRARGDAVSADRAARTLALRLDAAPYRRHVDDQRWVWANRATFHDWRAEREVIRRELAESGTILRPQDRQVYEDARIEHRIERRDEEEFPAAIARYRERWGPLQALSGVRVLADRDGARFRAEVRVVLTAPEER